MVEPPALASAVGERRREQITRLPHAWEMLRVRSLLVGVCRRDLDRVDLELVVQVVEYLSNGFRRIRGEERGVRPDAEAALLRRSDRLHGLVEDAVALDELVVPLAQAVEVDDPREVGGRLEVVELLLQQDRVRAEVDELLALHELGRDLV